MTTSRHVIVADRIPASGKSFRIEMDETERSALAKTLGIPEVTALKAELSVEPLGRHSYSVKGTLMASVVQTDVVTLEPLRQEVNEAIDLALDPAEEAENADVAILSSIGEEPERGTYENGRIDLGAVAGEHLALALDPYPRAPGVEFSGHVEDDSAADASPFAVLAPLKRNPE